MGADESKLGRMWEDGAILLPREPLVTLWVMAVKSTAKSFVVPASAGSYSENAA
jgi:hypothetical protein